MARNSGKDIVFSFLMIYALTFMGQTLVLLLMFIMGEISSGPHKDFVPMWWSAILYSFCIAVYFHSKKRKILNLVWNISYVVIVGGLILYRIEVTRPEVFFTAGIQISLLLGSFAYPLVLAYIGRQPKPRSPTREEVLAELAKHEDPPPSLSDDEMTRGVRKILSTFLDEKPSVASAEADLLLYAKKTDSLEYFIDNIVFPELQRTLAAILLYSEFRVVPQSRLSEFLGFTETVIPSLLSLASEVPGYGQEEVKQIQENVEEFMGSFFYSDKMSGILHNGIVLFTHAHLVEKETMYDLRESGYFNEQFAKGLVFGKSAVYSFVDGLVVREVDVKTIKEYSGSQGYSAGTTIRLGDGIPPLRLGVHRSTPQYRYRKKYNVTFDMTGTLFCLDDRLLFADSKESYQIPYRQTTRVTSGKDEDDDTSSGRLELNVVLENGVTWTFRNFPDREVLLAFKSVVLAAIAEYRGDSRMPAGFHRKSFLFNRASTRSHERVNKSGTALTAPPASKQEAEQYLASPNILPEETQMVGTINYLETSKAKVAREGILEATISERKIFLKWMEEQGQRRPSLVAEGTDGVHYHGKIVYQRLDYTYSCTLTRYSGKIGDLLIGKMIGEGEEYVCWFEIPNGTAKGQITPSTTSAGVTALSTLKERPTNRIGVVSRSLDFEKVFENGVWDYSEHFGKILTVCDDAGCDTVLFSPFTLDLNSQHLPGKFVSELQNVKNVYVERMSVHVDDNDDDWPPIDNLAWEAWVRDTSRPIVMQQHFATKRDANFEDGAKRLLQDLKMGKRTIGNTTLLVCGESGIVTTRKDGEVDDPYEINAALSATGTKVILNPLHSRMGRPHNTKAWRAYLSRNGRYVLTVWNTESENDVSPWTLFHDGAERTMEIQKLNAPFPTHPEIAIGIVDIA